LLQPFVGAAILAGQWTWLLLPALLLVVLGFMLKEPLVVLARQRWVWMTPNPRTATARRWLVVEFLALSACLVVLAGSVPLIPLAVLAAVALLLTVLAVWFTVRNWQRSVTLQLCSAAGLSTSALLVTLLTHEGFPVWIWQFWALLTVHAAAAILIVHERLRRIAARKASATNASTHPQGIGRGVAFVPLALVLAAAISVVLSPVSLWAPLLCSAAFVAWEQFRFVRPQGLDEALRNVGFRTLGASIAHLCVTLVILWPSARL
jgi:hypothetical protein